MRHLRLAGAAFSASTADAAVTALAAHLPARERCDAVDALLHIGRQRQKFDVDAGRDLTSKSHVTTSWATLRRKADRRRNCAADPPTAHDATWTPRDGVYDGDNFGGCRVAEPQERPVWSM